MQLIRARLKVSVLAGGLAVAVGTGIFLSPPESVNAFGTLGRAEAAAPEPSVLPDARPGLVFPGVDGVDLLALGYRGVDLDAVTVADLDGALPELPIERAAVLRERIVIATAHVEGLRGAEYVLYETARSMKQDVRAAGADAEQRRAVTEEKDARVAELRALIAQQAALRTAQPALYAVEPDSAATVALAEAEVEAVAAAHGHATAQRQLIEVEARRQAHRTALDLTHRSANRMDDHIQYLSNELQRARSGMLSAGRWLAEEERARTDVEIVRVEGFRVNAVLAEGLRDLLAAAEADGIDLRGRGFRPVEDQIELREQNCGTSEYAVFEAPSSSCSPPTAKPGRSLHETGLAIDFRHGGESITSRSSPAYRWLAANAPAYGLFNLPAEPWHWSVSSA